MAMKKKPVTGMKDITPREMEIRDYVIRMIKDTYGTFGFSSIETPCVEHIENLSSKQGGENEKLIFKILKRGEKLKLDTARKRDGSGRRRTALRPDCSTVQILFQQCQRICQVRSKHCRWEMYGVRTDRREAVTASSCSVISIFWESRPILAEIELILATTTTRRQDLDFKNFHDPHQ